MEIFISRDGRQFGPFSKKELRLRLSLKYFEPNLWAWHVGLPEWKPLYDVIPLASVPKHPDIHNCSEECKEGGIASLSQLNYLRSLGVEYPFAISKQQAGALLGAHATRVTVGQRQRLAFYGVSSAGMTKETASQCLDELTISIPIKRKNTSARWKSIARKAAYERMPS